MVKAEQVFKGSLAAAEASRDTKGYSGFMSGLFEGVVRRQLFRAYSLSAMSQEAQEFEDMLRLLLIEKVDPERIDREGEITEDVFTALRQIGAFGIKIPKAYGGLGLSQAEYHTVATLLGGHDASTTVLLSALFTAFSSRANKPLAAVIIAVALCVLCVLIFVVGLGLIVPWFGPWLSF